MRVSVSVRDGVSEPLKQAGVLLENKTSNDTEGYISCTKYSSRFNYERVKNW